ncbi:MAG TPA: chemotaxis protein CheB, partial [Elusimicrobiota bacterium]|nr:chemotaxis protein CheB [Elusimicrobiota bacterium]
LTGLGEDGVAGLAVLRAGGARTAAQEGSTCFAAESPRLAVESGAARDAVPLNKLPAWILENAVACLESEPTR